MLVLSRKRGELVKIGHNIWVKILQTGQSSQPKLVSLPLSMSP